VTVKAGRFGPYVTDGTTNATLPRTMAQEAVTLDEAIGLLNARRASGGAKKTARGKKASAKASSKAAASENAAAKKATTKTAAKKTGTKKAAAKKPAAGKTPVKAAARKTG
jgi:DNA topoisomerase-1